MERTHRYNFTIKLEMDLKPPSQLFRSDFALPLSHTCIEGFVLNCVNFPIHFQQRQQPQDLRRAWQSITEFLLRVS